MQIQAIQIINYKSFYDSGEIKFTTGFNVIVGQNDAGKSALIEALSLKSTDKPHRSSLTLPQKRSIVNDTSIIKAIISVTSEEIKEILSRLEYIYFSKKVNEEWDSAVKRFQAALDNPVTFVGRWRNGQCQGGWVEPYGEAWQEKERYSIQNNSYPQKFIPAFIGFDSVHRPGGIFYDIAIGNSLAEQIYAFRAERLNIGQCQVNANTVLQPDASNLAEVLNLLISSNPRRFERLLNHVRTVFPRITHITAPIVSGSTAKVMVWGVPTESERDDLAIPLSESGTGIGQVLSILYVIVTADTPKVIIIDEPQSFLHPGAARKLLKILREYSQHQYIITTHSPIAITATKTETLLLVRRGEHESVIETIDAQDKSNLKLFLSDVGASLSDVFGADKILWVEGKTEELCFPLIIKDLCVNTLSDIQVLAVQSTADLEGKLAPRVFDVYNKLTSATTLLPPAIAFILDREGKSTSEMEAIDGKSRGLVHWLPRRMYENYLLHPASIAFILNTNDLERDEAITAENVENWLSENATDSRYFDSGIQIPEYPSTPWNKTVHAAKLLDAIFNALTNYRVSYRKAIHGPQLTELLIDEETQDILELRDFLQEIFRGEI